MTYNLCFHCAQVKYGGIFVPCPACGGANTGDWDLDVLFSDHQLSVTALEGFAGVRKSIHAVSDDPEIRHWAFILFVSRNHPSMLSVTLQPDFAKRVEAVLEVADPPTVDRR